MGARLSTGGTSASSVGLLIGAATSARLAPGPPRSGGQPSQGATGVGPLGATLTAASRVAGWAEPVREAPARSGGASRRGKMQQEGSRRRKAELVLVLAARSLPSGQLSGPVSLLRLPWV